MNLYESCLDLSNSEFNATIECIADWTEQQVVELGTKASTDEFVRWMLLFAGALVFFMQAGFAMLCAGAVRKKNVQNTLLKNLLDACGAAAAFYSLGYGFAFGNTSRTTTTFIGRDNFFLMGEIDPGVFFFQYTFSATAATIVAGTLAERCKMISYLLYSFVLTGFVYPVVVHAIWSASGFLSIGNSAVVLGSGMIDFAGSGVVHMTGGSTALLATYVLGPRQGRFENSDGSERVSVGLTKGHSISLQMLGTMILWFGWYGFNPGSALLLGIDNPGEVAATAAVNTTLAAAAATISSLFTNAWLIERTEGEFELDIVCAMNGCLAGLVAITGGCGIVDSWAAVVIGIIAGWVYIAGVVLLINRRIDDAVDAIPVHLFNGIWGVLAVGLFAEPDLMYKAFGMDEHVGWFYKPTDLTLVGTQLLGVVFILTWTFVTMLPFFTLLNWYGLFRVHELDEIIGLDTSFRHPPNDMSSDNANSDDNEGQDQYAKRVAAYKKRFKEREKLRKAKLSISKKTSVEEVDKSWELSKIQGNRAMP